MIKDLDVELMIMYLGAIVVTFCTPELVDLAVVTLLYSYMTPSSYILIFPLPI